MPRGQTKKQSRFLSPSFLFFVLGLVGVLVAGFFYIQRVTTICANSISCIRDLSGRYEKHETEGIFMGKRIPVPGELPDSPPQAVLGEKAGVNKRIYVDLTNQKLYAFENSQLIYSFPVSTGKWGATPTGEFEVWIKLKATRMSGGNPALGTYYNLPNVPYTMFYSNKDVSKSQGFSIHGAYWHNNFGHPMSHGCVNMKPEDAKVVYEWATPITEGNTTYASEENPGIKVIVYGVAPQE